MINKENLLLLREHLANSVKAESFNMKYFSQTEKDIVEDPDYILFSDVYKAEETECGSVGCVLGHGSTILAKKSEEDWWQYANRVYTDEVDVRRWLFEGIWCEIDNTLEGAIKRIDIVLTDKYDIDCNWYSEFRFYNKLPDYDKILGNEKDNN